jgi:hypothetical protein
MESELNLIRYASVSDITASSKNKAVLEKSSI